MLTDDDINGGAAADEAPLATIQRTKNVLKAKAAGTIGTGKIAAAVATAIAGAAAFGYFSTRKRQNLRRRIKDSI